ncbi:MAG: hypothetical protein LBT54_04020 [Bifidobacteriaceae bacterium]|nr:hypothetical protein [Bifidobacteriaceae bacterium]
MNLPTETFASDRIPTAASTASAIPRSSTAAQAAASAPKARAWTLAGSPGGALANLARTSSELPRQVCDTTLGPPPARAEPTAQQ